MVVFKVQERSQASETRLCCFSTHFEIDLIYLGVLQIFNIRDELFLLSLSLIQHGLQGFNSVQVQSLCLHDGFCVQLQLPMSNAQCLQPLTQTIKASVQCSYVFFLSLGKINIKCLKVSMQLCVLQFLLALECLKVRASELHVLDACGKALQVGVSLGLVALAVGFNFCDLGVELFEDGGGLVRLEERVLQVF